MKHLLQKYQELRRLRTVSSKLRGGGGGGLKDILHCALTFALEIELFSLKLKLSQTSRVRGQKISFLTRFCWLAIVLINIQKSPSFLVALFAVCCIIFIKTSPKCVVSRTWTPRWWLYPNRTTLCVFSTVFVHFGWISLFSSAVSGRSRFFGTGDLCRVRKIQAISKSNKFSCLWWKNPSRNVEFLSQGMLYKILLMAKNRGRYTLFLRKLWAHNSSYYCL